MLAEFSARNMLWEDISQPYFAWLHPQSNHRRMSSSLRHSRVTPSMSMLHAYVATAGSLLSFTGEKIIYIFSSNTFS
ncbi:hypothetical protein K432DRAFT_384146 [Lepidopterella palustris CBS 459.81]|uniref:Uncharacterized protein n=1 Tax=Lepidopterella palustris CBS 459.81 TaxID=1314670 RepID=A0A8E2E6C3_9PEZI|nr:hypothetical protein K432DRAFT_384146 [Lepidopterella palustris CBS 459.81]